MDKIDFTLIAHNESETDRLGKVLASVLPNGSVVALNGTLGAGKTRLVRAIAEASGVDQETVSSPTFVLIHEYEGNRPIYHFDTYRLKTEDEFLELGPDDYFDGDGISLIEWADRIPDVLPDQRLEIDILIPDEHTREFRITFRDLPDPLRDSFQKTAASEALELI